MRRGVVVCFLVGPVCAMLTPACDRPKGDRLAQPVPEEVGGKPLAREGDGLFPVGGAPPPAPPVAASGGDRPAEFEPPEVILDGSEYGRLYPTFADIDGDGKTDLLVGVHSGDDSGIHGFGRLLVHLNRGTNARPVYAKPTWFDETVASARIPDS